MIKEVPPTETQEWCLARIAEHLDHIRRLREAYGPTARDLVLKTKAHIRALRSEYTAAAPINRLLPPEVLTEVFSHSDIGYFNIFDGVSYNNWRLYLLNAYKEPPKYFVR